MGILLASLIERQIEKEIETYSTREESRGYRDCQRQSYSTNRDSGGYSQIEKVGYGNNDALYSHDNVYMQRQTLYRPIKIYKGITIKNIQGKNREINSEMNLEITRNR